MAYDEKSIEQKAAEAVARAVNVMGLDVEIFAQHLCGEHRTLQQNFARAVWACIKQWDNAYVSNTYDMRNEDTVQFASSIVAAVKRGDIKEPGFRHV